MFGILNAITLFYQKHLEWPLLHKKHQRIIRQLKNKKHIKVVIYAMNLPMWNYQHLYELLNNNPRFKIDVVIAPNLELPIKLRIKDAEALKNHFNKHSVAYIDCDSQGEVGINIKKSINPDIIFYSQPYSSVMASKDYCTNFKNRLVCYYPYAFWSANGEWSYNKDLHRIAWKLFYSTELHQKDAQRLCYNHGKNVVVTGYPKTDDFLKKEIHDVWKIKDSQHKRLIWAPHFTIQASLPGTVARSNFLMMADLMVELAKQNTECLQIAFKPHPRLRKELYQVDDWGQEKTDAYFNLWDIMPNTFVADGEYIDLFMTSDAMIHDCSSFSIEYHYSQKPVMFITQDLNAYNGMLNKFGKMAIDLHYVGKTEQDIKSFIKNQVLLNNDPLKTEREIFYHKYLLPPHNLTVADYTYQNIIKSLGI